MFSCGDKTSDLLSNELEGELRLMNPKSVVRVALSSLKTHDRQTPFWFIFKCEVFKRLM